MTLDRDGQQNPQNLNDDYDNPENGSVDEQEEDAVEVFAEITAEDSDDSYSSDEDQTLDEERDESGDEEADDAGSGSDDAETSPDQREQNGNRHSQDGDRDQGETDESDLKSRNAKLQNDLRANSQRVRALNKHLAEARETIKKLQSSGNQAATIDDEQLAELESDFPEAAKLARAYAERLVNSLRSDLAPVHSAIDSNLASQQQSIEEQETQRLLQRHPDVSEILHGSQQQQFRQWLSYQSEGVRRLYDSPDADEAIALLDLYKRDNGAAPQPQANSFSSSGDQAPAPKPKADLSEHAELPRHGPSRIGTEPDDPVAIFNAIAD